MSRPFSEAMRLHEEAKAMCAVGPEYSAIFGWICPKCVGTEYSWPNSRKCECGYDWRQRGRVLRVDSAVRVAAVTSAIAALEAASKCCMVEGGWVGGVVSTEFMDDVKRWCLLRVDEWRGLLMGCS